MTHRALLLLTGVLSFYAPQSPPGTTPSHQSPSRLRPADASARALIDHALARSATVRDLVTDLEQTDVIVHVTLGRPGCGASAATFFVTATTHVRYLRITIDAMASPHDEMPLLAHELAHALEIARHPEVRDTESLRRLYARIGLSARGAGSFETAGARATERRARLEAHLARAKPRRMP